jgi:hypothetical protein
MKISNVFVHCRGRRKSRMRNRKKQNEINSFNKCKRKKSLKKMKKMMVMKKMIMMMKRRRLRTMMMMRKNCSNKGKEIKRRGRITRNKMVMKSGKMRRQMIVKIGAMKRKLTMRRMTRMKMI